MQLIFQLAYQAPFITVYTRTSRAGASVFPFEVVNLFKVKIVSVLPQGSILGPLLFNL